MASDLSAISIIIHQPVIFSKCFHINGCEVAIIRKKVWVNMPNNDWAKQLAGELKEKMEQVSALLFDLGADNANETYQDLDKKLEDGKSLVLLNANEPELLSNALGFGLSAPCIIIKPYKNFYTVNALGVPREEAQAIGQRLKAQEKDWCPCEDEPAPDVCEQVLFQDRCAAEQACIIEDILSCDHMHLYGSASAAPTLPLHQFTLIYLALDGDWNLTDRQRTINSVIMEISLFASYNPQYKYLRIRSMGAGCSPGTLAANDTYDRGYFQSGVNIHMQPKSNALKTLSTDPKNINKQTTYTTSSSFSVGVDISKNPSFSPSYTVSETTSTQISDFNIYNNGAGIDASWDFKLSMTEKSIWDMFSHSFMRKAKVKELPSLAIRNLQPVTEAVWYGANNLDDTIGVELSWKIDHYRCDVIGDWQSYKTHYSHKWATVGRFPFYLDFGSVHA